MSRTFLSVLAALFLLAPFASAQIAVKGEMVYTMAGDPIENGVVLIRDGKIERVGSFDVPDGYEVMEATVITPGLVDAHTVVGLAGYLNQPHDQDQVERSSPFSRNCVLSTPTIPAKCSWSGFADLA